MTDDTGPEPDPTGGGGFEPMGWWSQLEDDVAASAAEYEAEGWETLQLHTADVTPLDGEHGDDVGLSVLVPDDEFDTLQSRLAEGSVDGYEAYRTTAMGYVAVMLALEDRTSEFVALLPLYYARDDDSAQRLFEQAVSEGSVSVFVRRLSGERVTVDLAQPDLLTPPDGAEDG